MRSRTSASLVNSDASHGRADRHHRDPNSTTDDDAPSSMSRRPTAPGRRAMASTRRGTGRPSPAPRSRARRATARGTAGPASQIWCAATSSSLMRDAIAVAVSSATISDGGAHHEAAPDDRVRADAGGARSHRRALAGARRARRSTRYAAAAPYCAITVPHAEPAMPRSSPYTNSSSSTRFAVLARHRDDERRARVLHAAEVARTGEREEQRRCAEDADAEVRDGERMRRTADAPIASAIGRRQREPEHGEHQRRARPPASSPSTPSSAASRRWPAPSWRATARGGGVGEEVEDRERGGEHRARRRRGRRAGRCRGARRWRCRRAGTGARRRARPAPGTASRTISRSCGLRRVTRIHRTLRVE